MKKAKSQGQLTSARLAKSPVRQRPGSPKPQSPSNSKKSQEKSKTRRQERPFVIQDLPSPITIFEIEYKGKRIIYPLYRDNELIGDVLRPHLIRFEKQHFGGGALVVNWRTKDNNHEMDYYLQAGRHYGQFRGEVITIVPVFKKVESARPKLKDYQLLKCIGTGGFSRVYLARRKASGAFFAIKLMEKKYIQDNDRELMIESERDIMAVMDHPFVVRLEEAFQTKHFYAFTIEYCGGGELFYLLRRVRRLSEQDARFYFAQILLGIKCLHEAGVLYRDIKPENIMIDHEGHLKIADFGLSKLCNIREKSYSMVGSPEYMAPEMITEEGHNYLLDYYCLGALLYELVLGIPPYYTSDRQALYSSILNDPLSFPENIPISEPLKEFLSALLEKRPEDRLGASGGFSQLVKHQWLASVDFGEVLARSGEPPFKPNLMAHNYDETDILQDEKAEWQKHLKEEDEGNFYPDNNWFEYRRKRNVLRELQQLKIEPRPNELDAYLKRSGGTVKKGRPKSKIRKTKGGISPVALFDSNGGKSKQLGKSQLGGKKSI